MAAATVGQAMANATTVLHSFSGLKKVDSVPGHLQQSMAVGLRGKPKLHRSRVCREQKVRVRLVRSMAPELAEMEPASKGSQLLGTMPLVFSVFLSVIEACASFCISVSCIVL